VFTTPPEESKNEELDPALRLGDLEVHLESGPETRETAREELSTFGKQRNTNK